MVSPSSSLPIATARTSKASERPLGPFRFFIKVAALRSPGSPVTRSVTSASPASPPQPRGVSPLLGE
jgi:hypothetical protein